MSKIICDVCGASYDDAEGACPLCGWNPNEEPDADADNFDPEALDAVLEDAPAARGKAVFDFDAVDTQQTVPMRKSPAPARPSKDEEEEDDEEEEEEEEEKSGTNIFLVIILIILILALLGVSGWLLWTRVLKPDQVGSDSNKPSQTTAATTQTGADRNPGTAGGTAVTTATEAPVVEASTEASVPCTDLTLVGTMDKLTFAGQYWRLMVKAAPDNTTDVVTYSSADESVVTIDEYGRVTAVGEGSTTITMTCGDKRLETTAVVDYGTAATEAATTAPAAAGTAAAGTAAGTTGTLRILYHGAVRTDLQLGRKGTYITLELDGGIPVESATWKTSDASVAVVNNGNVTAIGKGVCTVTVSYNGMTAQCVIRCKW